MRGLGPFQMSLINVTIGVSDGRHQNTVWDIEHVKKGNDIWSKFLKHDLGSVIKKDLSTFLEITRIISIAFALLEESES